MSLIIFKFVLPAVIGYTLFIGISGKFSPFSKPQELTRRPGWFFGIWTGLTVTLVLTLALNMAYYLTSADITSLITPTASLLGVMLLPGYLGYLIYRSSVKREAAFASGALLKPFDHQQHNFDPSDSRDSESALTKPELNDVEQDELPDEADQTWSTEHDMTDIFEKDLTLAKPTEYDHVDTDYDRAFENAHNAAQQSVIEASTNSLIPDGDNYDEAFQASYQRVVNSPYTSEQSEEQLTLDIDGPENIDGPEIPAENVETGTIASMTAKSDAVDTEQVSLDLLRSELALQRAQANELLEARLLEREQLIRAEQQAVQQGELDSRVAELEGSLSDAQQLTEQEVKLHSETEEHLRITRRALSRLESQTRGAESVKADELIDLEQQLEENIRATSIAEATTAREEDRRSQIEQELVDTKQVVLAARKDARKNTAARAKVLATANKAIAFARQTVDARARAESELVSATEHMNTQQATISSLIQALDAEKAKSREEVSYLAKQLLLREKELEESAVGTRSTTENLTSRLVKKVARAKPVVQ